MKFPLEIILQVIRLVSQSNAQPMLINYSFLILMLFYSGGDFPEKEKTNCTKTKNGPAISWSPDTKLEWSDFKSRKKVTSGFSVAASTCGFGFDGMIRGHEILVNVYVRFYCNDSWKNPNYTMDDVLQHEQLHFDICELYGRKFYHGIVKLRGDDQLTEKSLKDLYDSLIKEYDAFQDLYDEETGHSTRTAKQDEWNENIVNQLNSLHYFSDYQEY